MGRSWGLGGYSALTEQAGPGADLDDVFPFDPLRLSIAQPSRGGGRPRPHPSRRGVVSPCDAVHGVQVLTDPQGTRARHGIVRELHPLRVAIHVQDRRIPPNARWGGMTPVR